VNEAELPAGPPHANDGHDCLALVLDAKHEHMADTIALAERTVHRVHPVTVTVLVTVAVAVARRDHNEEEEEEPRHSVLVLVWIAATVVVLVWIAATRRCE